MKGNLGVIGHPIKHSLSPVMHQYWFNQYGFDCHYKQIDITKEDLKSKVDTFRHTNWVGFNVTIPHKVSIMSFIDEVTEDAQLIGAVNTVINKNGKLIGTNTDGRGLIKSLKYAGYSLGEDTNVLIIGAGGAARAVGLSLAQTKVGRVDFTNRTLEKATQLSNAVVQFTPSSVLTLSDAEEVLPNYNLIINATSVGMEPWDDSAPLSLKKVDKTTFCVDLIYKPLQTLWLKEAAQYGCQTMNGLPMLVHQGALAFEHWFNVYPDVEGVEERLIAQFK